MNKLINRIVFTILVGLTLVGCQTKTDNAKQFLSSIDYNTDLKNTEIIYVSPVMGCKSCILKLLDIYDLYSTKTKSSWIFSGFNKLVAKKYFSDFREDLNYKMDIKENAYEYEIITSGNPVVLLCANQKIIQKITIEPQLNIDQLYKKLDRFILEHK